MEDEELEDENDEEELEDDEVENEPEDDEEELDLDDTPGWHRPEPTRSPFGPAPLWFNRKPPGTPRQPRRSRIAGIASPTREDPRARLRAITAELDTRHPHGSEAVKLLVEAVPYLDGVRYLRQYGEARGCHPEDVVMAERAAIGKGRR